MKELLGSEAPFAFLSCLSDSSKELKMCGGHLRSVWSHYMDVPQHADHPQVGCHSALQRILGWPQLLRQQLTVLVRA